MKSVTKMLIVAGLVLTGTAAVHAQQGQGLQMANFLQQWDMNGDGVVTSEDIAARRSDLFEMFDLDGSGIIDAAEQANLAATVAGQEENNRQGHGLNGPGLRLHAAMTLAYNDADSDGLISAAEWADAAPRLFAELDRNGDGVIDTGDFGRNG